MLIQDKLEKIQKVNPAEIEKKLKSFWCYTVLGQIQGLLFGKNGRPYTVIERRERGPWTSELTDILAKLKVITIFACLATYNSQRENISMNDASTKRLGARFGKNKKRWVGTDSL